MNDNINEGLGAFFGGILIGIFLTFMVILPLSKISPKAVKQKLYQEAISLGHAQWVINTNNTYNPELQFQWKTNSTIK